MTEMVECAATRRDLLDHQRGRLAPDPAAAIAAHLKTCADCADHDGPAERVLTEVLEPAFPAAPRLARREAASWPLAGGEAGSGAPRRLRCDEARGARRPLQVGASVAGARGPGGDGRPRLAPRWPRWRRAALAERMVADAVNDHAPRGGASPGGIKSANIHQVRPWFTGRLDLAPAVAFAGDEEFPLRGGGGGASSSIGRPRR